MKIFLKKSVVFFPVVFVLLVLSGCATKKNTVMSRGFHAMVTHYNYYYNANDRVKEAVKRFNISQPEKYETILPIFKLGDDAAAKSLNPDMDEAIKKASIAITRNSIYVKGQEHNRWIPTCYLLIGKAEFFKHDYWTAIETFQFIISEYKEFPERYEAMVWLTQTYMQLGKMIDAEFIIDFLKNDASFPKKLRGYYNLVAADYWMKKNDYPQTITFLEKAIPELKKRNDRIRYSFILAQLYQKLDSTNKAFARYEKVIKMNPPYEMAFNAKINRARNFDAANQSATEVKRQLNKMLKDAKNKEYQDQIYYALAGIADKENNESAEVDYLNKSVETSVSNNNQKGLSYLGLGEISFSHKQYRIASAYYDSTVASLSKDYPDYKDISERKMTLRKLVENLLVIEEADSMLTLANMDSAGRMAVIAQIIKKENEEKEKKRLAEEAKKEEELEGTQLINQSLNNKNQINQNAPGAGGAWYFYNQSTMSFGLNEFTKRWGDRKLEDNWRRKERQDAGTNEDLAEDTLKKFNQDSILKLSDEKRALAYYNNIPTGDKPVKAANESIIEAYYNIGVIYKEQLKDIPQSNESFEELLRRYPNCKYKLPCYYQLYRNYLALKNQEKSDYYKNLILDGFKDSEYAQMLLDPEYFAKKKNKTEILQVFYENTYRSYENKQYASVIERKSMADEMYPKNPLTPKFDYLKTLSIGHLKPVSEFELALRDIIRNYPNDSVSKAAKNILDYITGNHGEIKENNPPAKADTGYSYTPDSAHFFMLVFKSKGFNINEFKTKLSDYNTKFYSLASLAISNAFITPEKQYVMVKSFVNSTEAINYQDGVLESEEIWGESPPEYDAFIITQANFAKLFISKDIEKYKAFLDEKYNGEQ